MVAGDPRSIFPASNSPRTLDDGAQPSYIASPFIYGGRIYDTRRETSMYSYRRAPQLPTAVVSTEVRNNVSLAGVWNQEWIREDGRPWRRTLRSANNAAELTTSELFAQQSVYAMVQIGRYSRKIPLSSDFIIISMEMESEHLMNAIPKKNKDKYVARI